MTTPRNTAEPASATIATIAEEVGVSVATVSKVLNGHPDVARSTRARVEASLDQHQYQRRPRRRASGSGQIDLVFRQLGSDWAMEILTGVEAAAAACETEVAVFQLDGQHHPTQTWLNRLLTRRPLGVLLASCTLAQSQQRQLRRQLIPFVAVDTDSATAQSVPTVGANNWSGGAIATNHLLELGHRRIAAISGPEDMLCSRSRIAGYQFAHEEAGIPVNPELIRYGDFCFDGGYRHATGLLSLPEPPTAIFAGSDTQAMGVFRAARKFGLTIPRDLSVIGYDNLPLSAWTCPALTTVNQPLQEMAGTATRILLELIRGDDPKATRIDFVAELVVRESTARPPLTTVPSVTALAQRFAVSEQTPI